MSETARAPRSYTKGEERKTMIRTLSVLMVLSSGVAFAAEKGEAVFAGGCFWCMETAFEGVPGITSAVSGYAGGPKKNPTYEEVGTGATGHAESVKVTFDPAKISYARLLDIFWKNIDPLSANGQFCDRGPQYRSAIFWLDEAQKKAAEESKREVEKKLGKPVATEIAKGGEFWAAEEYHQDFYKKNPVRYQSYRLGCGRDRRLKELWGTAPSH
jgi:peptide-methionine (S)-S-oxide reductase